MNFKVGDIVKLKSGGPAMTVTEVGTSHGKVLVWCAWFHQNEVKNNHFPEDAVETTVA